jgi:hypothetical protein
MPQVQIYSLQFIHLALALKVNNLKVSCSKSVPVLEEYSVQLYHQTAGVTEMRQLSEHAHFLL